MKVKIFSVLRMDSSALHTSMHCLRHWLYHSKIASYSPDANVPSGHVYKIFGTLKSAPLKQDQSYCWKLYRTCITSQ